jgi:hypothetical protein
MNTDDSNLVSVATVKKLLKNSRLPDGQTIYDNLLGASMAGNTSPSFGAGPEEVRDSIGRHEKALETRIGQYIRTNGIETLDAVDADTLHMIVSRNISQSAGITGP